MKQYDVACPHCAITLQVEKKELGTMGTCPNCSKPFKIQTHSALIRTKTPVKKAKTPNGCRNASIIGACVAIILAFIIALTILFLAIAPTVITDFKRGRQQALKQQAEKTSNKNQK